MKPRYFSSRFASEFQFYVPLSTSRFLVDKMKLQHVIEIIITSTKGNLHFVAT